MDIQTIVAQLRAERDRLDQAIAALESAGGVSVPVRRGRKPGNRTAATAQSAKKHRTFSPEVRKKMAEAQKRRWAERRKAAKKAA
jgi:hypothetical protein